MKPLNRRKFLAASSAVVAPATSGAGFLASLSRLAAAEVAFDPAAVSVDGELTSLVRLILETPRERIVEVFVRKLEADLSYQQLLSALFLAAIQHGDPHQIAQVYSAHRTGCEVRTEERLLPLFWVLDRLALGFEQRGAANAKPLEINSSAAGSRSAVHDAISRLDPAGAERAVIELGRSRDPRAPAYALWEHCSRRASGTLGHHPIMLANTWRTLDALGWRHWEPALRYLATEFAQHPSDVSYESNRARVARTLPHLPPDWTTGKADRGTTLEAFAAIRQGNSASTCDRLCSQLIAGEINSQSAWDAVHLVAADLLFRYKTGGSVIGGTLVHAVTATDALRFGFSCTSSNRVRLLLLLQAIAMLDETFIAAAQKGDELRGVSLLDLSRTEAGKRKSIADIFGSLPYKDAEYIQNSSAERDASDAACADTFSVITDANSAAEFTRAARTLMCMKASSDPHDVKYPAAAFDDAYAASPEWLPYLLASSVHALHGSRSADAAVLVRAREALM